MAYLKPGMFLLICSFFFSFPLLAAEMQFHGTLIEPPPCTISDNEIINIDFGKNIGVNNIDGVNYSQNVDYKITCDLGTSLTGLILILTGNPTTFDESAVQTSVSGLGIRLLHDGIPAKFGENIAVDITNLPLIQAVPVKNPDVTLSEGEFTASATLKADYQ